MLSTLCTDDHIRSRVKARLEGGNLDQLLVAAEEFLDYSRKAEEVDLSEAVHEDDPRVGFTERLQGIVDRLKEAEGQR